MGIVEDELAAFELSAFDSCRIEQNSDGTIHLHMDAVRLEFTPAEFEAFAATLRDASGRLEEMKDGTHGTTAESAR